MGSPEQASLPRGKGAGRVLRPTASVLLAVAGDPERGGGGGISRFSCLGAVLLPGVFAADAESVRHFQHERHDGRVLHLPCREFRNALAPDSCLVQSADLRQLRGCVPPFLRLPAFQQDSLGRVDLPEMPGISEGHRFGGRGVAVPLLVLQRRRSEADRLSTPVCAFSGS